MVAFWLQLASAMSVPAHLKTDNALSSFATVRRTARSCVGRLDAMHSNSPSGITRVDDVVSDVVDQVVEEVHPLRVILFGSRATGRAGDHSDIDLLVVMPDGTPPRATMRRLYSTVRRTKVGADMLVTTPSILEQHRENVGLIYSEILETGVDVYVAS